MVVNMSIVARIKFSCNLKNSSSAISYYSYTKRCCDTKSYYIIVLQLVSTG